MKFGNPIPLRVRASRKRVATTALACVRTMVLSTSLMGSAIGAEAGAGGQFSKEIQPLLTEFCADCHMDGAKKGGVAFDGFPTEQALRENHGLWLAVLKNLRAGMMPPPKKAQPSPDQKHTIEAWIKTASFQSNPRNPDPGRVTVRRLNRVEYRNTVRDLLDVDFDTQVEFPADDSGHGFDNIGDVLTLSPVLFEKYLAAARSIVTQAVPAVGRVPAERLVPGREFSGGPTATNRNGAPSGATVLSYYQSSAITNVVTVPEAGRYQLVWALSAGERFVDNQFDYNKCRLTLRADGEILLQREFTREGNRPFRYEYDQVWSAGQHTLVMELEPLTPDQKQVRSLTFRIDSVTVRGPMEEQHWVRPKNYERFFPRNPPTDPVARREYAGELLAPFATRAYRRPVDAPTLERLKALAEATYTQPDKPFEAGIGQAMMAVLASPRFLFREEAVATDRVADGEHPWVDEYSLASRLSYFLWSTMPDEELLRLAGKQQLRENLTAQVQRMMTHSRFDAFLRNFVGQWLQTRDIESVQIDAGQVLAREAAPDPDRERRRTRFRELREISDARITPEEKKELEELRKSLFQNRPTPRAELTGDLRRAMRRETEQTLDYVVRQDRSLRELLDSDYTFLNQRLAEHYGLTNLNVLGDEVRRVTLPADSPRGGLLTQGTVLVVTSNPTRTSPVKRGLFILDNILGTPPPPPPPDIPALEESAKGVKDRTLSLRETLALHREKPVCSGCHNRMDPLGLALENFNALGMWRDSEQKLPIDAAGELLGGGSFTDIRGLKRILVERHASEFYRTLTEKILTYALGRGLEYYDVETVDQIVDQLLKADGRPSALFAGIIQSAPFQRTRAPLPTSNPRPVSSPFSTPVPSSKPAGANTSRTPAQLHADARINP